MPNTFLEVQKTFLEKKKLKKKIEKKKLKKKKKRPKLGKLGVGTGVVPIQTRETRGWHHMC